jgi:hypothetical protein
LANRPTNSSPSHPLLASAYNQLGLALAVQGKYAEAEASYFAALRHNPGYAEVHSNLGNLYQEQGRLVEALASYDLALVHDPQAASTHWNRALSLLQAGDFERGWLEYEWRWQRKQTPARPFRQPRWDGSPLARRTLLIYMEQGLGDMLQFVRYAGLVGEGREGRRQKSEVRSQKSEVKGQGRESDGAVIVECPGGLAPLFARCWGIDQVVAEGTPLPAFDVQVPIMSLPALFKTTLTTIPADVPYLFADEGLVEQWRERLRDRGQVVFRVGMVWQGNPQHGLDRYRSIPLRAFAPLAQVSGVQLISLQKNSGCEQLRSLAGEFPVRELPEERDATAGSFQDTAAIMCNLDLVISVDTATAHLAGGLGVPVWVPLSAVGEWRWLLEREGSPWYPTMRLFRQRKLGRWRPVFRRMAQALSRAIRVKLRQQTPEPCVVNAT